MMKAGLIISAATASLALSVGSLSADVEVQYPSSLSQSRPAFVVTDVAPRVRADVSFSALPNVADVHALISGGRLLQIAAAHQVSALPAIGDAYVEAVSQEAALLGGSDLHAEVLVGSYYLDVLAPVLLTTVSAPQLSALASLLIEILREFDDAVVSVDGVIIGLTKAVFETVTWSDDASVDFVMGTPEDAVSSSDDVALSFGKVVADSVAASTTQPVFDVGKSIADVAVHTDQASMDISKPLEDSFTSQDEVTISWNYALQFTDTFTSMVGGHLVNDFIVNGDDTGEGVLSGTGAPVFDFGKNLADTVDSTDALLGFVIGKALADAVTHVDATAIAFGKVLADTATATDASSIDITKPLTDAVTSSDAAVVAYGMAQSDSVTSSDALQSVDVTKVIADTVTAEDNVTFSWNYSIEFRDIFTSLVAAHQVNGFVVNGDDDGQGVLSATSIPVFDFGKNLAESVTSSDALGVVFGKVLADAVTHSDTPYVAYAKQLADAVTSSDSAPSFVLGLAFADAFESSDAVEAVLHEDLSVNNFAVNDKIAG